MNSIEDKNRVKRNFKNSLFSWKFLIIDSKFVPQNAFHYYEKFKRRKKSQKNTITNMILYTHTFSNDISNHRFHQIYTDHWFPHPSPKCSCFYLGLDLVHGPNYFGFD